MMKVFAHYQRRCLVQFCSYFEPENYDKIMILALKAYCFTLASTENMQ